MTPNEDLSTPSEPQSQPNSPEPKKLDGQALLRWLKKEIDAGRVELAKDRPQPTTPDEEILARLA